MMATTMRRAARIVCERLSDTQRDAACYAFTDDDRQRWTYLPRDRPGVALADLSQAARKAVHRLVATATSEHTFAQITTIMGLEEVLDRAESGRRGRHSGDFWIALFGSPDDEAWSWRFEGHHISITMSVVADRVSPTPVFLGANPATVRYRGTPVVRPLALEEELARRLLTGLPDAQRTQAIVATVAPGDIRTGTARDITDVAQLPGFAPHNCQPHMPICSVSSSTCTWIDCLLIWPMSNAPGWTGMRCASPGKAPPIPVAGTTTGSSHRSCCWSTTTRKTTPTMSTRCCAAPATTLVHDCWQTISARKPVTDGGREYADA
jgi:hypothetical protein